MKLFQNLMNIFHASSKAARADVDRSQRDFGVGMEWTDPDFVDYFFKSPALYAAIMIRANALARAPIRVARILADGTREDVPHTHPLQRLFDAPNKATSGADLRIGMEVNLRLTGKTFLSNEIVDGAQTLWTIDPVKLTPLPGLRTQHTRGYEYRGDTGRPVFYTDDEITPFFYFNPSQHRSGASPMASLRLTADFNQDAIRYNRNTLRNGGIPDFVLLTENIITETQAKDFYKNWDLRFGGAGNAHRPALAGGMRDMKTMAFSNRELEFAEGLKWWVEEVARVHGVPQPMLGSLREATLANVSSLERIFWRQTMVPECAFLAGKINADLLPKLGYPELIVYFDFGEIDVLTEEEEPRLAREKEYLDRGVQTINEVRRSRGLAPVPWGDDPDGPAERMHPASPFRQPGEQPDGQASIRTVEDPHLSLPYEGRNGVRP